MKKGNLLFLILGLILLVGFVSAIIIPEFPEPPVCGNGILEDGEECDAGWSNPDFAGFSSEKYSGYELCNSEDCECGTDSSLVNLLDSEYGWGGYWFFLEDKVFGFNGTCKTVSDCRLEHICLEQCYLEDGTTSCAENYDCNYYDSKITTHTGSRCILTRDDIPFPDCGSCQNVYNTIPTAYNCIESREGEDEFWGYEMCYYSLCTGREEYTYTTESSTFMCGDCTGGNEEYESTTPVCKELLNDDRVGYKCSGGGGFPVYQPWIRSEEFGGGIFEDEYSLNSRIFFNQTEKLFGCSVSSAINPEIVKTAKSDISYTIVSVSLIDYFDNVLETVSIDEEVFMSCGAGDTEFKKNITFGYVPDENTKATRCEVEITVVDSVHSPRIYSSGFIADFDGDGHRGISRTNGVNCTVSYPSPYSPQCTRFSKEFPVGDCNDWVLDDDAPMIRDFTETCSQGFKDFSEAEDKNAYCYEDTNNDGVGDFAMCSYCINPGMREDADDIDNDCKGSCQGVKSTQAPRSCLVKDYNGDGKSDPTLKNITSTDRLGRKVITPFGCGDVVNEWNISDEFCQMVDDVKRTDSSELLCEGYNRAVKWGQLIEETDIYTESGNSYYDRLFLSFKPGGIPSVNIFLDSDTNSISILSNLIKINDDSSIGAKKYRESSEEISFLNLPEKENYGKTKGTVDLPDQFIDSFRGELNFTSFWDDEDVQDKLSEKNSDDSFKFEWYTSCVPKDKCNDGVSNSVSKDLFETIPYNWYIPSIKKAYLVEESQGSIFTKERTLSSLELLWRLKDNDAPECKFVNYEFLEGLEGPQKLNEVNAEYRINPVVQEVYCFDDDKDGFCGCKKALAGPFSYSYALQQKNNYSYFLGIAKVGENNYFIEYCNQTYHEKRNSRLSLDFPDCDNDLSNDEIYSFGINASMSSRGKRILANSDLGWNNYDSEEELSAWHVHPFSPITLVSCNLNFDLNCNKNYLDGHYLRLIEDNSPFDFNVLTGVERNTNQRWDGDSDRDAFCFEDTISYPISEYFARKTGFSLLGDEIIEGGFEVGRAGASSISGFDTGAILYEKGLAFTFMGPIKGMITTHISSTLFAAQIWEIFSPNQLTQLISTNNKKEVGTLLALSLPVIFYRNQISSLSRSVGQIHVFSRGDKKYVDGLVSPARRSLLSRRETSREVAQGGYFLYDTQVGKW